MAKLSARGRKEIVRVDLGWTDEKHPGRDILAIMSDGRILRRHDFIFNHEVHGGKARGTWKVYRRFTVEACKDASTLRAAVERYVARLVEANAKASVKWSS